jgi:hypothetical protein
MEKAGGKASLIPPRRKKPRTKDDDEGRGRVEHGAEHILTAALGGIRNRREVPEARQVYIILLGYIRCFLLAKSNPLLFSLLTCS